MTSASKARKIEELSQAASEAVSDSSFHQAEQLAQRALTMARSLEDFSQMETIVAVLRDARMGRYRLALEVGRVTIVDAPIDDDLLIEPGCYVVQPPQVGADARRLRLTALEAQVPIAVVCREPVTQLGLCPVVSISPGLTVRTKVDCPDDHEHPDLDWFIETMQEMGDWAIQMVDPQAEPLRQVDQLMDALNAVPEHERLHDELIDACRTTRAALQAATKS